MATVVEALTLGSRHQKAGQLADAERCYRQALEIDPNNPRAWILLGRVLKELGEPLEAEASFRRALLIAPGDDRACDFLGLTLLDQRKFEEARAAFESALGIDSNNASAHNNLGHAFKEMHLSAEAESHFREAIRLRPRMIAAYNNLGALLLDESRHQEAIGYLTTAVELDPRSVPVGCNLARALEEAGRLDDAAAAARRTIELDPKCAVAHLCLGTSLKGLGQLDEVIESYRMAVGLDPGNADMASNLVYALNYQPDSDPTAVFNEHREWGRTHADPVAAASRRHAVDRGPERRLRIGYVSGHFWAHAVNFFTEPVLAAHDRERFEVFCYCNQAKQDDTTRRLQSYADHWRPIDTLDDDAASELVRSDQIDILVDLAGHIAGNRLLVFARKPAPIQVTYLGYQNTTGMTAIDYRLTDDWADPSGTTDAFHTETLVRLPRCFFCYQPSPDAPPVNRLPAIEKGFITFGSFNNFAKVTPQVLSTWAAILNAVPGSRLVVLANAARSLGEYLTRAFEGHGISGDRVTLADRRPRSAYLDLIRQVDIALDPFPFNGHTTTCDALWQGVPVVTLAGRMYASRFGSSAHVNLGLQELIAGSPDEYVKIAVRLAGDVERLAELRAGMRDRMLASPLLDFAGFTRNLEAAYRRMWTDWCAAERTTSGANP